MQNETEKMFNLISFKKINLINEYIQDIKRVSGLYNMLSIFCKYKYNGQNSTERTSIKQKQAVIINNTFLG